MGGRCTRASMVKSKNEYYLSFGGGLLNKIPGHYITVGTTTSVAMVLHARGLPRLFDSTICDADCDTGRMILPNIPRL